MTKYLFIQFDDNYADEFDVKGFHVLTETQWEDIKVRAEKAFDDQPESLQTNYSDYPNKHMVKSGIEWYFGTNEFLEWQKYEEWLRCFKTEKITAGLTATLKGLFGYSLKNSYGGYGVFPTEIGDY